MNCSADLKRDQSLIVGQDVAETIAADQVTRR
jgi:hypothetical protein